MDRQTFLSRAMVVVALFSVLQATAGAATVSVQFITYDGWSGSAPARSLAATDVAGLPDTAAANYNLVYTQGFPSASPPIPNYNDGGTHTLVSGKYNQFGGFNPEPAFVDDGGNATAVTVSASGFTRLGILSSPFTTGTPNQDLMSHAWGPNPKFFNPNNPTLTSTLTLGNLNASGFTNYDVIVYLTLDTGDTNDHPATFILDGGTPVDILVDGNSAMQDPVPFAGAAPGVGNYVRYSGLTGNTVSLAVTSAPYFNGVGFAGFQIVQAVPEPASLGLLAVGGLFLMPRRRKA